MSELVPTRIDAAAAFTAAVDQAYSETRKRFDAWAADLEYKPYVVPASTAPRSGFTIFYTPPAFRPTLLIVGQNPSEFSGSRMLNAPENAQMLSGTPPTVNS